MSNKCNEMFLDLPSGCRAIMLADMVGVGYLRFVSVLFGLFFLYLPPLSLNNSNNNINIYHIKTQ